MWVLGYKLGLFAARLTPAAPVRSIIYDAAVARGALEELIASNAEGLKFSIDAAKPLLASVAALTSDANGPATNLDDPISDNERTIAWSRLNHFASVLGTELPRANVYFVNQKRGWDTTTLIESGEKTLSTDLSVFSESSRKLILADIRESTRCLAFDIPTAAGFHVFRAVETVVLEYFPVIGVAQSVLDRILI